ncbi:MAG: hypothetical protein WCE75_03285 [Terracidiphilus sp.]
MVVVPLPNPANDSPQDYGPCQPEAVGWVEFTAASALIAGGVMMLLGQKRAGMVAAAAGTAMALADQQGTLKKWWDSLPHYIDEVQEVLNKVQSEVDNVAAKRETLVRILSR